MKFESILKPIKRGIEPLIFFFKYLFAFIFYEQHIIVVVVIVLLKIVNTTHNSVGGAALPKHVAAYNCIKHIR